MLLQVRNGGERDSELHHFIPTLVSWQEAITMTAASPGCRLWNTIRGAKS